jgi:Cu/Ag efflux pump CusA
VPAFATLILDVTKTVGFFAVTQIEFDLNSVAALLTLIGYSVTDKVVVYDRIRENLGKYRTMPLRELIDLSINQTLGRTVATSLTVVLSILPLALIGGAVMRGFALAIIFGSSSALPHRSLSLRRFCSFSVKSDCVGRPARSAAEKPDHGGISRLCGVPPPPEPPLDRQENRRSG